MRTAEQAGLTDNQYVAVEDHIAGAQLAPTHQLVLTRYAPVWEVKDSPFAANYVHLDTAVVSDSIRATVWDGSTSVVSATLVSEDGADADWLNTTPFTLSPAPRDLSFSTAALVHWRIPADGSNFFSPFSGIRTISGYAEHQFLATVGPGGYQVHLIGTTSQGNWLLAHHNAETIGGGTWVSNIYWPYQVRSFDAVRMDGYDIIAMETDLPPIDDWTVTGTKTTMVAQRVQGIVFFKYDYVNHLWSSHYVLDQVDNQHDRAIAHIKLTVYDGVVFATYFRNHNGTKVLCVTKSADGINWENPVYLPELADSSLAMSAHYPVSLIRNGKYLYLIGAGGPSTAQVCYRALATDYMGTACTENTLDVTHYVMSAKLSIDSKRAASVILGDPTVDVAEVGYGLTGLLRGALTNHALFSDLRAMRARLSLGYSHLVDDISDFSLAHFPVTESTVVMTLTGHSIVSDDGYGSLRPALRSDTDTASWVKESIAGVIESTHALEHDYLVPGTLEAAYSGGSAFDDTAGGLEITIPETAIVYVLDVLDAESASESFYPVLPVTPGACTIYTADWSMTNDGAGAFEDVPNGITGEIDYDTGTIRLDFASPYTGTISTDITVAEVAVTCTVDYDTATIVATGMNAAEAQALDDAAYEFIYSYAPIHATLDYATGTGTILVDGVETAPVDYSSDGSDYSETLLTASEDLLVEQLYGVVAKVHEVPGLEGSISLEIQDPSVLATLSGNSDSNEWLGVEVGGDNFAPLYEEDTSGASGLKHTVIKEGVWTGSTTGLVHSCDDDEGLAITDVIKRSMNVNFVSDVDFYCSINSPVKLTGGTAAQVLDDNEYAGLGIRMKDQHAGWWLKITPNADRTFDFQLVLRHSVTTNIPGLDGAEDTVEVTHVDTPVGSPVTSVAPDPDGYDDYYVGKVIVRAYYNKISVYLLSATETLATLISYEAIGMGELEFLAPVQDTVYDRPALENSLEMWPFTYGYCAYIAKGTGIYVDYGTDVAVEVATTVSDLTAADIHSHGSDAYDPQSVNTNTDFVYESTQSIKATCQYGVWAESGFKYEIGEGSIDPPGSPLGLTDVLSLRFKADIWLDEGEAEKCTVRAKAKVWYSDGSANRQAVEYTEMQKWHHFEWTCDNPGNKTIDGITFFFYDPLSDTESMATVFYVDNIQVMRKETQRSIYFGNMMASNDERCYTTEEAEKALYAYSGQHDVVADDLLVSGAMSVTAISEIVDSPPLTAPLVVDFDITSNYFSFFPLAIATDDTPIEIVADGGIITCQVTTKPTNGLVKTAVPYSSVIGRVRLVVTTLSSSGLVYSQDATLVKDWLSVVIYVGDAKLLSGSFPIYTTTELGDRLFFGATGKTMSFSSARISIANRVAEVFSIDPGETASNPLGRLLGTANIVPVAQPNGSLRLKSVQIGPAEDVDWVLPGTAGQVARDVDLLPPAHVRYTAARDEKDVLVKRARTISWGHGFDKRDDPNAITEDEMLKGVLGIVTGVRRSMRAIEMTGTYNPFVELDDTLGSAAGDAYLVDNVTVQVTSDSRGAPMAQASYKLGGDWFGSLDANDALGGDWYGESGEEPSDDGGTVLSALALPGQQSIYLAWNDTDFVKTGFQIERSLNGVDFTALDSTIDTVLDYTDTSLSAETPYYYRVRPFRPSRNGGWSNVAWARTGTDGDNDNLTVLRAIALPGSQRISLLWADTTFSETGFRIERGTDGTTFAEVDTVATGVLMYTDDAPLPNTLYYYRVYPYDGGGDDTVSNIASAVSGGDGSATILNAVAVQYSRIIELAWSGNHYNKTGFRIERGLNGVDFTFLVNVTERTFVYYDAGLTPDTRYYYRVCPYNANGNGSYSNIASDIASDLDENVFPVTRILDDFNRFDQGPAPSNKWDEHGIYEGYPGSSYALKVESNECVPADGIDPYLVDEDGAQTPVGYQDWGTSFNANHEIWFEIAQDVPSWNDENNISNPNTWIHSSVQLWLRNSNNSAYFITVTPDGTNLYYGGGGALGSSAEGYVAGDQFGMRCVGDRITVYKNRALIIGVTDGSSESGGKPKVWIFPSKGTEDYVEKWSWLSIDNFGGGNL